MTRKCRSRSIPTGMDEILRRAAQVYQGLSADEITQVENIALDRQHFFREPAA